MGKRDLLAGLGYEEDRPSGALNINGCFGLGAGFRS
jgi:hypothetical protein